MKAVTRFALRDRNALIPAMLSLSMLLSLAPASMANSPSKAVKSSTAKTQKVASKSSDGLMPPLKPKLDDTPASESPSSVRARILLKAGARLHQQGNSVQAENLFRQAIALDPTNADAYFDLGALAEGKGDLVNALGQYRAGLALRQNDPELKEAVRSIEGKLRASARDSDEFRRPEPIFTVNDRQTPLLEARGPRYPLLSADDPDAPTLEVEPPFNPQLTSTSPGTGPFQLNVDQSQLNVPLYLGQPDPLLVNQPSRSIQNVSQRRNNRGALSILLTVGANAAMRGGGLHCPRCTLLRGFGGFGF
jgi:hypothetical protein